MLKSTEEDVVKPLLCNIALAGKLLSLGRSSIYKLVDNGSLESVKVGNRRLILLQSIDAFIDELREAA